MLHRVFDHGFLMHQKGTFHVQGKVSSRAFLSPCLSCHSARGLVASCQHSFFSSRHRREKVKGIITIIITGIEIRTVAFVLKTNSLVGAKESREKRAGEEKRA